MIIIVKKTENIENQENYWKCMFSSNAIYPFPREGLFWHISGAHNHVPNESNIFNLNGLNRRDKISFGATLSPNIPSLTVLLEKLLD